MHYDDLLKKFKNEGFKFQVEFPQKEWVEKKQGFLESLFSSEFDIVLDVAYKIPKYKSIKMRRMGILKLENNSIVFRYEGDSYYFYLDEIYSFKLTKSNYFNLIFYDKKYNWYPKENIDCNQLYELIFSQISLKKGVMYHVGSDILKGLYYVEIVDCDAFIEISKDGESVFTYSGDINQYVELHDGEDIFIKNASIKNVKQDNLIKRDSYTKGSFKVGKDIPEGEYYLKSDLNTYFKISKDANGGDIIFNKNTDYDVYITLYDGEYFRFDGGILWNLEKLVSPKLNPPYHKGMYKVGRDIPEGEYYLKCDSKTYFQISMDTRNKKIIRSNNVDYNVYIRLCNGEYFQFDNGILISVEDSFLPQFNPPLQKGMYKVGRDIPEGEYYLKCDFRTYFEISKNRIIYNDNVDYDVFISLYNGQYFTFTDGFLVDLKTLPKNEFKQKFKRGMYKVGKNIPEGMYLLEVDDFASFVISMDNRGKKPIFYNKSNENSYISLKNGQYFKFNGGELIKVDMLSSDNDNYIQGVYKVGKDIPEGEYYISAYDDLECRVTVFDEADKKFEIIFKSGIYITLNDGDYIHINKGRLSKFKNDLKYVDDCYFEGMYKVGDDLPQGTYVLKSYNEQNGFYRLANDSNHNYGLIFDLNYIKEEIELDLSHGQYIMIENAKMKLKQ